MKMSSPLEHENLKRQNASVYHQCHSEAEAIISALPWKDEEVVLDYGCGTGTFAQKYLFPLADDHDLTLYGVDCDEEMIRYSEMNCFHESMSYSVGDIMQSEEWTFGPQEIDKMISFFSLSYIDNFPLFLQRVHDSLKPLGYFAAVFSTGKEFLPAIEATKEPQWAQHVGQDDPKIEFADWCGQDAEDVKSVFEGELKRNNFSIVECKVHPYQMEFQDLDRFCDYLITMNSSLGCVPSTFIDELRNDLTNRTTTIMKTTNSKPFKFTNNVVRIIAQRI